MYVYVYIYIYISKWWSEEVRGAIETIFFIENESVIK